MARNGSDGYGDRVWKASENVDGIFTRQLSAATHARLGSHAMPPTRSTHFLAAKRTMSRLCFTQVSRRPLPGGAQRSRAPNEIAAPGGRGLTYGVNARPNSFSQPGRTSPNS